MGMNVPVADEFARLVETKVASGRYELAQDSAEQADEEKRAWLREAIREGEASGSVGPLDAKGLMREARRRRLSPSGTP